MNRKFFERKTVFLGILTLLGGIFTTVYLIVYGNRDEVYSDVVMENSTAYTSNKTSEMQLIYILVALGVLLYVFFYFWSSGKKTSYDDIANKPSQSRKATDPFELGLLCFLLTAAATFYFAYQNQNPILLCSLLLFALVYYIDRTIIMEAICFFYLAVYAVQGLYCLCAALGGEFSINYTIALSVATVLMGILLIFKDRKEKIRQALLMAQFLVPFLWLALVQSKYLYQGEFVIIPAPNAVKAFVYVMALCSFAELLGKRKAASKDTDHIISLGSCIAIVVYNNFLRVGSVLPTDMHHPFENIFGFSQVFELGQGLFTEYIPVSGMYSLLHGAIFEWFGDGLVSNYYFATNIFYALFIIVIVGLLALHIKRPYVLLFSLVLPIIEYDRVVLILPIMLLLSLPALIRRKNLWLMTWFLTSFVHGLYYPLFGAAVCIAFMPLGIWQIYTYIRSGAIKKSIHKISFWAGWAICVVPALLSVRILWGTAQHILAMSKQTVHSDGVSRFGQIVLNSFAGQLKEYEFLRIAFFHLVSFLVPALFVWVAAALTLEASGVSIKGKKIEVENPQALGIGMSIAIMPVISFSYTMVRLDPDAIYARSIGPLVAGFVMLFIYCHIYIAKHSVKWKAYCFAFFIPAVVYAVGFTGNENKMSYYYAVPEQYQYIENESISKLGTGFINPSQYETIQKQYDLISQIGTEMSHLGTMPLFGYYYLFDIPVASAGEISGTIRGYDAAQETVNLLKRNEVVVGSNIRTWQNYYLYHYLVTSGDYRWETDIKCFLPVDNAADNTASTRAANKNISFVPSTLELGKNPASLGRSMESLEEIFTAPQLEPTLDYLEDRVVLRFSQPFDGDDADWMYIEFDVDQNYQYTAYDYVQGEVVQEPESISKYLMKKDYNRGEYVLVAWDDDDGYAHGIRCRIEKGKLLIPLGSGLKYLLNEHDHLMILADRNGERIQVPPIKEIQMLKLREVN